MSATLTSRVLRELREAELDGAPYPNTRELAARLGASLSSVHTACDTLRSQGKIENHAGWGLARQRRRAAS